MSGTPNKEGITKVIALIDQESKAQERISSLTHDIARWQAELGRVERNLAAATKERLQRMREMDLADSGKYGYEQRMANFLAEIIRQTKPPFPGEKA